MSEIRLYNKLPRMMTGTRILAELNKGVYSTSIDCKLTQTVFQGQSHNQDMVAAKLLISF